MKHRNRISVNVTDEEMNMVKDLMAFMDSDSISQTVRKLIKASWKVYQIDTNNTQEE